MPKVRVSPLPADALLRRYVDSGAYTDCYSVDLARPALLSDFVEAFYTTPLFKLERRLLSLTPGCGSTDAEVRELALGKRQRLAVWSVEAREPTQIPAGGRSPPSQFLRRAETTGPSENRDDGTAPVPT